MRTKTDKDKAKAKARREEYCSVEVKKTTRERVKLRLCDDIPTIDDVVVELLDKN